MTFVDLHTHQNTSDENVISILNCFPTDIHNSNYFSIGIHPWYTNKETYQKELTIIEKSILHKNCLAIGECGLDKLKGADLKWQIEVFKAQVLISEKFKKPLIIHCVKAYQEIIALKKELKPEQYWIVHGFNKNIQLANQLIKNDIKISIGVNIFENIKLQNVIKAIQCTNFYLETDDAEIDIQEVYRKVSKLKGVEVEDLKQTIFRNFNTLFIK